MSARPLRRFSRAPDPEGDSASPDGGEGARLQTVPEAFVAGELARLEGSTEARIEKATERIRGDLLDSLIEEAQGLWQGIAEAQEKAEEKLREQIDARVSEHGDRVAELSETTEDVVSSRVVSTLDERLAELESSLEERLERKVDARLESLEGLARELRTETERLSAGLEESSQAVVDRASVLVYEQVRRADAAELERTRIARASLKGLGEEVERIRAEASQEIEQGQERITEEVGKRQAKAAAELEARLSKRVDTAVTHLTERFEALETRTAGFVEAQMEAVWRRSDAEIQALAQRAGVLVFDRIQSADSRVEEAVISLAREIDAMRSVLRAAGESSEPEPEAPSFAPAPPPPGPLPPGLEFVPLADESPGRFPRLRRAFRLGP